MKHLKIPKPERFQEHIIKYFRSLLVYKDHIAPAMNKQFGTVWPVFNAYLCPICLQNLIILTDNKLYGTSGFDLDHYPPACVGGKNTVIVCEPCNNLAGSKFESKLIDYLDQQSYNLNILNSSVKADAVLGYKNGNILPGNYKIRAIRTPGSDHTIDFGNLKSKPIVKKFISNMNRGKSDWNIKLTFKDPDYSKVSKALVKAAYLYCFCLWGYEFAFSDNAEHMRMVFSGEIDYPATVSGCCYLLTKNVESVPEGVAFIDKPETHKNLVVNIPLRKKEINFNCIAGIVIPKPIQFGWDELKNFKLDGVEVGIKNLLPYNINHQLNGYTLAWKNISKGTVKEKSSD